MAKNSRSIARVRRHGRVRKSLIGTADRPRLNVFRSLSGIYVQVIDDLTGRTVASAASTEPALKAGLSGKTRGNNKAGAEFIGQTIAARLKDKGITKVVFDRNGYLYHGRIQAVADAARKAGLEF